MSKPLAHAEDGSLIESEDFPFEEIFEREEAALAKALPDLAREEAALVEFIQPDSDFSEFTPEQIEAGIKVFTTLLKWIWQSGMKNSDGVKIRAIICCWIFLQELRSVSETDMAVGYGMKKQSLERWVKEFKIAFPHIRISQLR